MIKPTLTNIDRIEHPMFRFVLGQNSFRARWKGKEKLIAFQYKESAKKTFSIMIDEETVDEITVHPTQWVILDELNNVYIVWPNEFETNFEIEYGGVDE